MAENRPGLHLLRAGEALLRASADALGRTLERAESGRQQADAVKLFDLMAQVAIRLHDEPARSLDELEHALRAEHQRWAQRSDEDVAAKSMRDGIAALLAFFDGARGDARAAQQEAPRSRHARRRRGFAPR